MPPRRKTQSEADYREIFDAAGDALFVHDAETGEVVDINRKVTEMYGFRRDELDLLNAHFRTYVGPPHSFEDRVRHIKRAMEAGPFVFEWLAKHRDGRRFWVEVSLKRASIGGCDRILAAVRDVTERKAAEEALRQSEARYRAVVESQAELIVRFLPDGTLTFANDAYCRYFNRTREETIGINFLPFISEDDRREVVHRFVSVSPAHPIVDHEHKTVTSSGEIHWMHWTNRGVFDEQGRLVEFQATGRDITDRKRAQEARQAAEAALRQSEENYRLLFEHNIIGIAVIVDGRFVRVNQAMGDIFRRDLGRLVGMRVSDVLHPDEHERVQQRIALIMSGEIPVGGGNYRIVRSDGTAGWVEVRSGRMIWEGKPALLSMVQDITERMRLEEELREAQKMEAVGQLAGGIAHDFNNLMTGILCHAGLLKTASRPGDEVHETAGIIEAAARRASDLTGQLLGFARRGKHQDVPVDLCETVRTVIRLVGVAMEKRIRIEVDGPGGAVWTHGDPAQMEQVILNLAVNARDAMPAGGRMGFAVREVVLDEKACAGRAGAKPGRHVCVAVSDTGCGIPDEIRGHLFEPFFTTKPLGKGIGMGLAMVYGIAKNHGGWVEVTSQVDRGSTFTVYLPVSAAPRPKAARRPEPSTCGVGCILLVDDDAAIRQGASRMLTAAGYRVASAANVDEALRAYDSLGCKVDLVIIDMVMPGGDGGACFHALRRLDPTVKAILCTAGGVDEAAARELLGEGMVGFMPKPFQMDQLAAAVRKALAGG